jgi:hypothetical protein
MEFNFNATTMAFSLATIQNAVNISSFCFRCTRVAFQTWSQLQVRAVVVSSVVVSCKVRGLVILTYRTEIATAHATVQGQSVLRDV